MKMALAMVLSLAALPVSGLAPATQATVIFGAGKAGSWDTEISVTNADLHPLPITITTQFDLAACGPLVACNIYAETTIAEGATFVLPSIPNPPPGLSSRPQIVYVLSPSNQLAPAVAAFAFDAASGCGRGAPLPVAAFAEAFNAGDLFFPGISRDATHYANLLLAQDPIASGTGGIGVGAVDQAGTILNVQTFEVAPGQSILIVDVLAALGVDTLEGGSIRVSKFFLPNSFDVTPYAAALTLVEPGRLRALPGKRNTFPQSGSSLK